MSKTTKAPVDSAALDTLIEQLDKYRVDPKAKRTSVENVHLLTGQLRDVKAQLDEVMTDPYEAEEEKAEEVAEAKKK